ncbi:mitochondrial carrier domain-containing protein [Rhodocollybia butyracea]|uniref:Mitochondrial carrier domain-containing protein n=1 Tax=Rhodocollybia butyracea TaxID=206335 RepID=A0A9P5U9U7_9AGAR|nr:mitochondrial carrier domain-containing protein [Rhodocollybia butyracea]
MDPVLIVAPIILALASIATPFGGVLVRYRVLYTPNPGIQIQEDVQNREGLHVGYFTIMKRVIRIEGWAGLFKGFIPTLGFVLFVFVLMSTLPRQKYPDPNLALIFPPKSIAVIFFGVLAGLPLEILKIRLELIFYRAIVTSHKLSILGFRNSLKVLLTPYERRRPWTLYTAPGLVLAFILLLVIRTAFLVATLWFLVPILLRPEERQNPLFTGTIIGYSLSFLALAIIIAPLEVIVIRLSVQRNFGDETSSTSSEVEPLLESSHPREDVSEHDTMAPYTGLVDTVRKIGDEEGWKTLFRGWKISLMLPHYLIYQ